MKKILRQDTGRFDRRFRVGPARWEFWDLLWLHEGRLELRYGAANEPIGLFAPAGVLIPPETDFQGHAVDGPASASVTHFEATGGPEIIRIVPNADTLHVQHLVQLSLDYARRGESLDRRKRLLISILDCFSDPGQQKPLLDTRLDRAWREATNKLDRVRSVADVAVFSGQAESTFRAAHRKQFGSSAGRHLQQLRLSAAERYLATTGFGLAEIAGLVGYGHAETLSAAFKKSRGHTPGNYRRWSKQFA